MIVFKRLSVQENNSLKNGVKKGRKREIKNMPQYILKENNNNNKLKYKVKIKIK